MRHLDNMWQPMVQTNYVIFLKPSESPPVHGFTAARSVRVYALWLWSEDCQSDRPTFIWSHFSDGQSTEWRFAQSLGSYRVALVNMSPQPTWSDPTIQHKRGRNNSPLPQLTLEDEMSCSETWTTKTPDLGLLLLLTPSGVGRSNRQHQKQCI